MAHAAVTQDLPAPLAALPPVLDHVEGEHRAELLDGQGMVAADPVERSDERACSVRDLQAGPFGDLDGAATDEARMREPLRGDQDSGQRGRAGAAQKMPSLRCELAPHLFRDRSVDDHRVLRGAEQAVVEGLAGQNVPHCLPDVRGALDVGRRIARTDAVSRLAGRIGGADEAHAARRQDDRDTRVAHQRLRARDGHRRHAGDCAGRRAGGAGRALQQTHRPVDAVDSRGVRTEHDRTARLHRDQQLVDGGGGGVGRWCDGGDHAERLGDLHDAPIVEPPQHADRLHRPDEVVHGAGREEVLPDLVGPHAVPGLFHGGRRESLGMLRGRRGHGGYDSIDLLLAELGQGGLRIVRPRSEPVGLLGGAPVEIGRRIEVSHGAAPRRASCDARPTGGSEGRR